jgi:thiol:disulfide interchange protein DsbC
MKPLNYLALLVLLFCNAALADDAAIKAAMEKKFPYEKVISVNKTPYFGLYEVVLDDQLIYTDEKMTYLFSGNIIDMQTMQNLTEAREKQLYAIKFDTLPFELAIKHVKGNGKRRLAVFTDPNCPYCKNLEKEMVNLTDVTVYIFMFPILPGSEEKVKAIWCSPDKLSAWEDTLLRAVKPQSGKTCDTKALDKIPMLAKNMGINVTPTLIFEDGVIKPGGLTFDQIDQRLTASSTNP